VELSRALDSIHASARGAPGPTASADAILSQKLAAASQPVGTGPQAKKDGDSSENNGSAAAISSPSGLLAHAAEFDARLALVEAALGISTASNPFVAEGATEPPLQPVLPALDHLTSRLSALTSTLGGPASASAIAVAGSSAATTPQLEALTTRIKKLTADADALAHSRKRATDAAKAANAAKVQALSSGDDLSASSSNATEVVDPASTQRDEQAAKIQALYATLPTIQSLHPLLPSVLERLRSLRAIHAGAAQASETLDTLEKHQTEMSKEIEQWREGLRIVEEKVKGGEAAMKKNIDVISPWVKDLETRLARLEESGLN
jgi:nuclear migration protein JNM1